MPDIVRQLLDFVLRCRPFTTSLGGLVVAWSLGLVLSVACGQEDVAPAEKLPGATFPDILREGVVQTQLRIWLNGEDGKPVFVADGTLEELLRLRGQGLSRGGASPLPAFSFGEVQVRADARKSIARIEGEFKVILSTADSVASVPLRMDNCRLTERPVVTGDRVEDFFQAGREQTGYEWLLLGPAGSEHSIRLNGVSNVAEDADRRSLRFSLPVTPCQLTVLLPPGASEARARLEDVIVASETDEGVELAISSNGGDFNLSWRLGGRSHRVAAVEADSKTVYTVRDPSQAWAATSSVNIRWYGIDATDKLVIRLPPGGRLRNIPNFEYELFRISRSSRLEPRNPAARTSRDATPPGQAPQQGGSPQAGAPESAETTAEMEGAIEVEELLIENYNIEQSPTLDLTLDWEWSPELVDVTELSVRTRIPGLIIEGIDSHSGTLDCNIPTLYSVVFEESSGASLIQQGPADDAFGGKQLRFRFDRQSFELHVAFRREQSLPIVRPTYHVHIDENKLMLTAWLECSFDANQYVREIGLVMPDNWVIQENTAQTVLDPAAPLDENGEALRVRRLEEDDATYMLTAPDTENASFNPARRSEQLWRIVAERDWTRDDENALEFHIPKIIRGSLSGNALAESGSGILLVTSENNFLLRDSRNSGLLADSFSSEYQKYIDEVGVRKPLVFRFQTQRTQPYWAGKAELLPQQISVTQKAEVTILNSQIDIRQIFDLRVANKALSELRFAVRQDADDFQQPQVYVDGNAVSQDLVQQLTTEEMRTAFPYLMSAGQSDDTATSSVSASPAPTPSQAWRIYQLAGPPELLGQRRIEIGTACSWDISRGESTEQEVINNVAIPLVKLLTPIHALQLKNDWVMIHSHQIEARPRGTAVRSLATDENERTLRPLTATQDEIGLELHVAFQQEAPPIHVARAWLQTAITGYQRRDRFVAQVVTDENELRLQLPEFIDFMQVHVDGSQQDNYRYDNLNDTLVIELPSTVTGRHVIEISYRMQESLSWITRVEVKSPRIEGTDFVDDFSWQLLTPAVHHLGWCPRSLSPEWQWIWSGLWWQRNNSISDLERAFATVKTSRFPASFNNYLMSGQQVVSPVGTWVFSRFSLWFPVGAFVIFLSYSVLNYPSFRHPMSVLGYALTLAALSTIWPDLAMLLGQTSLVAMGLGVLVLATQVAVDSRVRRRSVFTSRPVSHAEVQLPFSASRSLQVSQPTSRGGTSIAQNGGD